MKWKTFFLVSKVLAFRHTKQTNKNVADTTFKIAHLSQKRALYHDIWKGNVQSLVAKRASTRTCNIRQVQFRSLVCLFLIQPLTEWKRIRWKTSVSNQTQSKGKFACWNADGLHLWKDGIVIWLIFLRYYIILCNLSQKIKNLG